MTIFHQKTYLLFLTLELFAIQSGSSQEITGNCSFDRNTLCSWSNDKDTDHFDWQLRRGSTPSSNTGPTSDHSGNGLYIYIETSHRKYDEKARLNSPWMRGARRMTFYYSMYGSTVESLSVFVRISGSEERIWSRHGNQLSRNWTKGCVAINYNGTYQVVIEGMAGVTFASNIAVDDFNFSTNLTCVSVGEPTPQKTFQVNCTFDKSYCGWRSLLTPSNESISWNRKTSGNQSQGTGPSQDHTGGGVYIYVDESQSSQISQSTHSTQLLSTLIHGPKCLRFYYYMYGGGIGNLDVFLWPRAEQDSYLMWQMSGEQGDAWMKAGVDIGYTGESQVSFQATIGRNYLGGIAVDDVTLTNGLCEDESEPQNNEQGNCNFDTNFCFWRDDLLFSFTWTRLSYDTPSRNTGPSADHTTGAGGYVYIETSRPRLPGDTARLASPWMRGPQCITFYYHMYGATMGCVVIYIKSQATNELKPVWLRSQDQGNHWIQGQISINETSSYQIIVDGIRGSSYEGDAALDDVSFEKGTCQQKEETTFYVSSNKGKDFRISTQPSKQSLYSEEFRFTLEHPRGNSKEKTYFIYSEASSEHSFVSSKLDPSNYKKYPLDVVVLNNKTVRRNSRRVYLIDRSNYGPMISLDDHGNVSCCREKQNFYFYAHNVTASDHRAISGCEPSWYKAGKSCYLLSLPSAVQWSNARTSCHRLDADLAVISDGDSLQALAQLRKKIKLEDEELFVGLSGSKLRWLWLDGETVSNTDDLWGPHEPSGDGRCGSFLKARDNSNWDGYGWRWNDLPCATIIGYICEKPLAVPLPMAFFSLSGTNGTVDRSPDGTTKVVSSHIKFALGPYGSPNGSFFFSGLNSSYVKLKNTGELDARFSMSVFVWVHLDNSDGQIFKYGCSMWVFQSTLGIEVRFVDRKTFKVSLLHKKNVLVENSWNFIGTTYDYKTGIATVWVNNETVMCKSIGKMELATQNDVRVGASSNQEKHFRGRVSCLQFYDQALSVDQIIQAKARCNQSTPLACSPNFFPFHGGCFLVNTKNSLIWQQALAQCKSEGGTLAKISREGLRYAFSNMLEGMTPRPSNFHFGLISRALWTWIDGSLLNESLWMQGYPAGSDPTQSCAVLSSGSSKLKNVDCKLSLKPLCQKPPVSSLSQDSLTQSSSALSTFDPSLAIDRSYTTCFRSKKESNPWWQVTLENTLYVESVEITDKIDCCPRDISMINVTVSTSPAGLDSTCAESMEYGGNTQSYKFHCSPPARGSYVTVTLTGDNVTLVLCQVFVKTIEIGLARGVLREAWYNLNDFDLNRVATMREHSVFNSPPESQITLREFDAPVDVAEKYVQRLTSYLQVPVSGNYTFYVSCDDWCELWKYDVHEHGIETKKTRTEDTFTKQPITAVDQWTGHVEWNKYPDRQMSQPIFLDKCRIYQMEVFMREIGGGDHVSVGMRKPSGEYERPIPGKRLFWTKPGTRNLTVTLQNHETRLSGIVGSKLHISGFHQFCCEGVYCPDCPLELNISTLGQNVTLNLALDCVNTSFTATFNTDRQPGNFTVKVIYSFVNNPRQIIDERTLGHVHLQAAIVEECSFELGLCGWTSAGDKDHWKLSSNEIFVKYPGSFVYIDNSHKARLESSLLPWKPFQQSLGLCLRFHYLMPTKSKSNLKVFLRETKLDMLVLAWQMVGYHGEEWSVAQVAWRGAEGIQILFEGEGFLDAKLNVAIDNIIVTTENCSFRPNFAEPDFRCGDKQFTCKNGQCVKKNLRCDGDFACKDESDEDDCECPSSQLTCQGGGCLPVTDVCDGKNDCSYGDDENNCRNPCPSRYQCVDGSCVPWSNTCSQTTFCRDGSNTPSVCGSGKCHLNNLACNSTKSPRCKSFRGHCSFRNGQCGLKSDRNATFQWTVGSGQTPTEKTGPSYDHTSFSKDGSYIFIEASQRSPGDKARLFSDEKEPNEVVCVQFWYHMHGLDIGSLGIYLKTNQSETLVWRLSGDQGNRWRFGQTALNSTSLYTFVIEGTVFNGSAGDIAVDDLMVLDGDCEQIIKQASPDCDFEESMCDWDAHQGWVLRTRVEGFETSGGFVASLPAGASDLPSTLSSPAINIHDYEWKCLRFWYFIGTKDARDWHTTSLIVLLRTLTSDQVTLLFVADEVTDKAQYIQMPLSRNSTNSKIYFVGFNELSGGPFLAIDDVSFTKEPCKQIPWRQNEECQKDLGMENGEIADREITASSQLDANHAAIKGRLNLKATGNKAASWSAVSNDPGQWLQVDLGSPNTKVTRVATQGRNHPPQWVTKYKLQFSNDIEIFRYYTDPRQIQNKDFVGNADQNTVVYQELNPPVRARYIRFLPQAWHRHISMRVELYGCRRDCQEALGMENGSILDGQISASSELDDDNAAIQGRLYFQATGTKQGAWSAAQSDLKQWLQVDLGSQFTKVTRVATQNGGRTKWVTRYKLQYSNDGVTFQNYREKGQTTNKEFSGNTDKDSVVYHDLNTPIRARFIRFGPVAWNNAISMRIELYGCHEECQEALGMRTGAISDAQITASSIWDSSHEAFQGRLNFQAISMKSGSWSAGWNDLYQWLEVFLRGPLITVTGVATQGRSDHDQWVTRYRLTYSDSGLWFRDYTENGPVVKIFDGNRDRNTVVYHDLLPPILATRFIRFKPVAWWGHISMRVELYGCPLGALQGCWKALGMESGAIADRYIQASSQLDSSHAPSQGRLHLQGQFFKAGSWSAGRNDLFQWLQIDLGSQYTKVTRVATQGRNAHSQWVTRYRLLYGNDGLNFQYYRDQGKPADEVFAGNTDADTIIFNELNPPIRARFIRFHPEAWDGHISMRVELYGCPACLGALGMQDGSISDGQISASSQLDSSHAAFNSRLHFKATAGKAGSWSARSNDVDQWLQIDLGSRHTEVTRVATQGRNDYSQWVVKYKLQYSNDGVNFQYYMDQGKTTYKNFTGNIDQDTVVYHELSPLIRARYIRFLPQAWVGHISMRVELYGCQGDQPCETSVDWCGWKNIRGWKRVKYQELDQDYQDDSGVEDIENVGGNYEIYLPDISIGYVSFSDFLSRGRGFSICFWLKTAHSGFFIEYAVAPSGEQNATLVLGLYFYNRSFDILFGSVRSNVPMDVTDNTWHHVCVVWDGESGLLAIFKDGERKHQSTTFRAGTLNVISEGIGTMTIGFRATNKTESVGILSGFNVWSYAMMTEEILRMSYGCGHEAGDAKAWHTVKDGLKKRVPVEWSRTCNDRKGDRLEVDTNATHFNRTAVLVSPLYNRSRDGHSKCLKFRYMLRGPGEKTLTIYQKEGSHQETPVWVSKRKTGANWIYGQVPLSSISQFQVSIKGETEKSNDSIALTGLYIDEKYCKHEPLWAKKACSKTLFNMSGYFYSPSFPGYYLDDMSCTWHITVPSGHTIHLEFQEFRLEDNPMCKDCFVRIIDGKDVTAPTLGRFCGFAYPPLLVSSSNHFTIALSCNGDVHKARFKAFYHSVSALDNTDSSCIRQQGCPSSCECKEFGEGDRKKILVTGEELLSVPSNLPFNTGAVNFQQNRIFQLREMDFSHLPKLEYIDMSFNVLIHLEEETFHNVTSVTTLRLNSNFFRTLPVGAFTGLPSLLVLDLGTNLLRKAHSGLLDGLPHLQVLSLRSNQIDELEYGVFANNSNMTHLYLQDNKLTVLPDGLFGALSQLKLLNLSSNELTAVTKDTFQGLISLEYLYLDRNKLAKVPSDAFSNLENLKYLKLDRFILCCYAKKSIEGVECESPVDEFSSCDDLMKNKTLQICIWILGILAFLGNLLVIIWRIIDKEENKVHSFLLTNLAVADMLMGVYLLTIAIMDLRWQGEYFKHDEEWRSGLGCQIVGVLSMLSSEVSVLILTIITIDRFLCIVFPFKFKRLTYKAAVYACLGVWIFGVVISTVPIAGLDYFYDDSGNFGFYSRSAVCLPLQLSEGRPAGWEYSVAFFVGLNFVSFMFILLAYITMFWTVKRVARAVRSTNLSKESAMAKRLVFIVMTDFCCWMPIIIINILSLTGHFDDPDKIAYVWIAVFVLPLNSSLNPILYTFSTERAKRSLGRKRKNVTGFVMKTVNGRGAAENQSVDWLKTHGHNTFVSNVSSSPLQVLKAAGTQERENKQVHAKLRLIEEVDILQDDTAGRRSTGYATAWCEEGDILSMVLLKYFDKQLKEEWLREADIMQGLSCNEEPHANLLHHRWHSKASDQSLEQGKQKIRGVQPNSFLICYDFVSSSTLQDFLCEKGTVLNFDTVCAIACDVISAVERLQDLGILHNNIKTSNILIGQCPRLPPITAVLGGFSRASKVNEAGAYGNWAVDEQSSYGNDIELFGQLLATLLGNCHGSSEYIKLHEIMNLCFEEKVEKRHGASYIRRLLEEAWSAEGMWDTYL